MIQTIRRYRPRAAPVATAVAVVLGLGLIVALGIVAAGIVAVTGIEAVTGNLHGDRYAGVRAAGDPGTGGSDGTAAPQPLGGSGPWEMAFSDEFDGPTLDLSRWTDASGAEADEGHGNLGNDQLEWNRAANCALVDGHVAMTARREAYTSTAGIRYGWTSCLLSSAPSYAFRYGYIEERAILPGPGGFWPAFWTWQAGDVARHVETDVYEFYSANRRMLVLTQHSGTRGGCNWRPWFDPGAGWHTYGAAIEASGTVWYVDGVEVCRTTATSDAPTNIISNLAVHAVEPPAAGTDEAVKRVDYIRAWQRG